MRRRIKLTILLFSLMCLSWNVDFRSRSWNTALAADVHMFSVHSVGEQLIWACGDRGSVYHSVDGGITWSRQPTGTTIPLRCIFFADANTGWTAGKTGTILHTADGGESWETQKTPKTKVLFSLEATTPEKCWAVGDWGTLLYTEDGGKTWQDRTLTEDIILYDIDFQGEDKGWIAGEFGTVLYTDDGGENWTKQDSGIESTLFGISFGSPQEGIAVGLDGIMIKTNDGGQSWQRDEKVMGLQKGGTASPFFEVRLKGHYAVAVGDAGMILTSSDGGDNWSLVPLSLEMRLIWLRGAHIYDGKGIIVGANGMTILTRGEKMVAMGNLPDIKPLQGASK